MNITPCTSVTKSRNLLSIDNCKRFINFEEVQLTNFLKFLLLFSYLRDKTKHFFIFQELQTALNDKNHLSSELEIIYSEHAKEIEALQEKHSEELHEYKDRVLAYKNDLETLESARDNLEVMVDDLRKESEEEKQISRANAPVDNNQSLYAEKISLLEIENDELAEAVEHLKAELTEALKMNLQCDVHRPRIKSCSCSKISFCFDRVKLKI